MAKMRGVLKPKLIKNYSMTKQSMLSLVLLTLNADARSANTVYDFVSW